MILETPTRKISFPRRPLLMGIVNINDDTSSHLQSADLVLQRTERRQDGAAVVNIRRKRGLREHRVREPAGPQEGRAR